jgi:hypothetical protein
MRVFSQVHETVLPAVLQGEGQAGLEVPDLVLVKRKNRRVIKTIGKMIDIICDHRIIATVTDYWIVILVDFSAVSGVGTVEICRIVNISTSTESHAKQEYEQMADKRKTRMRVHDLILAGKYYCFRLLVCMGTGMTRMMSRSGNQTPPRSIQVS